MPIGEAMIQVECDKCEFVTDSMSLAGLAGGGWDARNIPKTLTHEGWRVDGDVTICPECIELEEADKDDAAHAVGQHASQKQEGDQ